MNIEQLLLIKLMEECAEVQQVCAKTLRFGLSEKYSEASGTNAERIIDELTDVFAVLSMMQDKAILNIPQKMPPLGPKLERINKYMEYSRDLGILE